jgi:hypothetical protein
MLIGIDLKGFGPRLAITRSDPKWGKTPEIAGITRAISVDGGNRPVKKLLTTPHQIV